MRFQRALITGASAGIGESFAEQLAAQGADLVLVARRAERLAELAGRLRRLHNVEVEVLPADLADAAQLRTVEERLRDESRPIDLLVNNAGIGETQPFADCPVDSEERTVRVNVLAPTRLCHAAISTMAKHDHGGIINVSSVAGQLLAFKNSATYGASKAYISSLSESLRLEAKERRVAVSVTALCPGYVHTDMTADISLPAIAWVSREKVVRDALRGVAHNKPIVVPGLLYKAAVIATRLLPKAMVRPFAGDAPSDPSTAAVPA